MDIQIKKSLTFFSVSNNTGNTASNIAVFSTVFASVALLFACLLPVQADETHKINKPAAKSVLHTHKNTGKNGVHEDKDPEVIISEISQSLLQMHLKKGVSIESAAQAMISKAEALNFKLVARHKMSEELNSRGIKTPHLEMFQFCNVKNAGELVSKNRIYAAYLPCQISITSDGKGNTWLMMRNMDMMIDNEMIPPELAEVAIRINQAMLAIITAGATGEF